MRPSGSTPSSAAISREPTNVAIAPSLIGEELPAVTVPSLVNAGFNAASFAAVVSGRIDSSRVTDSTGNTYPSCRPLSHAAAARSCERSAHSSCASREMPSSAATASAQAPSDAVHCAGNFGFTMRQPTCVG